MSRLKQRGKALPMRTQQGVSLIELMIALALGAILVLGITQVFSGVRASFGASEGLSRLQENARFAMEFLRRDARMAGHFGCRSEYQLVDVPSNRGFYNHTATTLTWPAPTVPPAAPATPTELTVHDTAPYTLRLHRPVEVYDYSIGGGTSPGNTLTATLLEYPTGITAANNFTPALPTELVTNSNGMNSTTGLLGNDYADAVPGSDIVVLRYLSETSIALPGGVANDTGVLTGSVAADYPAWRIFAITNCNAVSLFQVTSSATPAISLANGTTNLNRAVWGNDNEPLYGLNSPVYQYEFAVYYVGRTGAATPPSLFRRRLLQTPANANAGDDFGPAEELIPGVEMMQVLVGADNENEASPAQPLDDVIDVIRSPSQHLPGTLTAQQVFERQRAIKSLRFSLLIRSPELIPGTAAPAQATRVVGDVIVTPPADFRLRHTYDSVVAIRNRIRN